MSSSIVSSPSAATTTRPGATRNPSSSGRFSITRSREVCRVRAARQQPFLDRLDLQCQIFRVDAALRQAAGDEPKARLAGARIHVAQFLALAEAPDRADARRDLFAEQSADQVFLRLAAGRPHDMAGGERLA